MPAELFSVIFLKFPYTCSGNVNPVTHMNDEILSIREISELLKIDEKTAYSLTTEGQLPGFKVGGSWRFDRQKSSNWIKCQVEGYEGIVRSDNRVPRQAVRSRTEKSGIP